jgi:hypothetical protein
MKLNVKAATGTQCSLPAADQAVSPAAAQCRAAELKPRAVWSFEAQNTPRSSIPREKTTGINACDSDGSPVNPVTCVPLLMIPRRNYRDITQSELPGRR